MQQTGYGDTSDGGDTSDILLEVTVDTFSDTFCDTLYRDYDPSIMVCAGTEGLYDVRALDDNITKHLYRWGTRFVSRR